MIRIPATGVMLDADDLATVRAALTVALATAERDTHLRVNPLFLDGDGRPNPEASLARFATFAERLEAVRS